MPTKGSEKLKLVLSDLNFLNSCQKLSKVVSLFEIF
jgi:hypothetical protein